MVLDNISSFLSMFLIILFLSVLFISVPHLYDFLYTTDLTIIEHYLDTVGMVALDQTGSMSCGTSSSGLFMKKEGRVGDSPLSGSGFYVDSEIGGATATGLGEDLMKGCLSYETVRLMGTGMHPQAAVQQATMDFAKRLERRKGKCGAFSLVAMNNQGEWGVATNVEFSFAVATDQLAPTIYLAYPSEDGGNPQIEVASQEWLDAYQARITAPIK